MREVAVVGGAGMRVAAALMVNEGVAASLAHHADAQALGGVLLADNAGQVSVVRTQHVHAAL